MTGKNRYFSRAHLSKRQFRAIVRCFAYDMTVTQTAEMTGVGRKTVTNYVRRLRELIVPECEKDSPFTGVVQADDPYCGGKRKGDKRGRGVTNKVPVFGILKQGGKVYTQVILNASKAEIRPIIKRKVTKGSAIHTDGWKAYDGLVVDGYRHYRVNHSKVFSDGRSHINGIENFRGWSKRRLAKFCGISREHFNLHLKECEFRFNHRHCSAKELYGILLSIVRESEG